MPASGKFFAAARTFAIDVANGFLAIIHNSFALLGLAVAFMAITLFARPDLRDAGESQLRSWLTARQMAELGVPVELAASDRATATNPKNLPKEQAAVAFWLSKKYRVAPEPIAALVSEAYDLGKVNRLDPTLILAIMAIESSFNPFAQSAVGAQGLMQVMTTVHTDKYENFGGQNAAFDPVSNLRVGVRVLKECIERAGSIEGGLRYYVGAANLPTDGGYAAKVLAEHQRLRMAAGLRAVPLMTAKVDQPRQAVQIASTKPATPVAEASGPAAAAAPAAVPVSSSNTSARSEQVALQSQEPAL
ncbi:transglycosylase SLT domain protein [Delftia acidovorans]|uniref:Lytic transglycosylase n=2 Tax=Pseudomonadati TaxID=3379134 RepID=A0A2G7TAC5_9FLAO|nr:MULTISPECIES: lytic transglycosylase domain-containing protein [Delftia]KFJ12214.1 transglycosylase SLT domain protein [Delftia acidovorans]MBJ2141705.1 lytic transglycosylase domain-containing protein [Delftia acidovorans]MBO0986916.1 lytic transglycosylase domain-containing protein [Delftia sp. SD083]MBO1035318.1 lytic transglycosylase domain-containing protein [Delftia sp. SD018]MCB4785726.1 lytic transglycosylase domain-containing protein [Delftia sp. Lp-1]